MPSAVTGSKDPSPKTPDLSNGEDVPIGIPLGVEAEVALLTM